MAKKIQKEVQINKLEPTYFPMGLGVKRTEDDIIIVEFIDFFNENDKNRIDIIGSYSLTTQKAKELVKALNEAIDKKESKK